MKTFIKILSFIFLLLINSNCKSDEPDFTSQYVGNYEFTIISTSGNLASVNRRDTTYFDGTIRIFKKEDGDVYYKSKTGQEVTQNKITIQYQKDKIITFQVLETGEFVGGGGGDNWTRWGGFTSIDTVIFRNNRSGGNSWDDISVVGIRK